MLSVVFPVDILHDFFPPLVLEVHVYVGRFIALARNESFKQDVQPCRVDLCNAQAEAHR